MLLPTILIIAVNLALGFLAAVGRERMWMLRTETVPVGAESPPSEPAEVARPEQPARAEAEIAAPQADGAATNEAAPATVAVDQAADEQGAHEAASLTKESVAGAIVEAPTEAIETSIEPPIEQAMASLAEGDDSLSNESRDDASREDAGDELPEVVDISSATAGASAEVPAAWFDMLADIEREGYGKCQSFVEASTQVLRLEVGKYRAALIDIDRQIRAVFADFQPDALAAALDDLDRLNADWLLRQNEAVGFLTARRDSLGELQTIGQRLEEVLLDQTAQIESTRSNLRQLDFGAESAGTRRRTLGETGRLVDMAHALRDQLQESLLAIMIGENRLASLDRRLHLDALTGFVNRTGLEVVLYEWQRDDPHRIRPLSLIAFDVARTARFNERHGAATGDAMLAAVGKIIDGALRKKRGCDLVARHSGQRFVVVLGDTGPRNATSAAERIRQVVAASTFEVGAENVQVTATCGVVEVQANDDSSSALSRLDAALLQAKRLGRNLTCLDEGDGPTQVENPPDYQAKGKIIRLGA